MEEPAFGASAALVGREAELETIAEAFARLPESGGALLLHGEPGIGKSSLLEIAAREAQLRDFGRLATVGAQSEADVPFAGLHQIVRPLLGRADELPRRQRDALLTAMGVVDGAAPERFLIALATLELLALAAAERPVLVTVEDLHWLDRTSRDVIAFVARRIESEPILVIAASRQGPEAWPGDGSVRPVHVQALAPDPARKVLERSGVEDFALQQRLLQLAAGNPLALVELPRAADRSWLTLDQADQPVPLTARLERSFAARTAGLPEGTRTILLVASLGDDLPPAEVFDAVRLLRPGLSGDGDVRPAVQAGLVAEDAELLQFLHPLMRSAVQIEAGPDACRAAHSALGQVLAATPERGIWHRASACVGRDDEIAGELVATAEVALGRGALAAAAKRFERAAQLATDPTVRVDLLLRAAEAATELNDRARADALLGRTRAYALDDVQSARRERVRENFGEVPFSDTARIGELVSVAGAAAGAGVEAMPLALALLFDAALRCFWTSPAQAVRQAVIDGAERLPLPEDTPIILAILGMADPDSRRDTVSHHIAARHGALPEDADDARLLGLAAYSAGEFRAALDLLTHAADTLRTEGRLGALGSTLVAAAWAAIALGETSTALPLAEEGERLTSETGLETWTASVIIAQALVTGFLGRTAEATQLANRAHEILGPSPPAIVAVGLDFARGITAFGLERYEEAYATLTRVLEPPDPSFPSWDYLGAVSYLADTAVLLGRLAEIRDRAGALGLDLNIAPSEGHRPGESHALAVIADTDEAITDALTVATSHFDRARLELARGSRLRRHREIVASRAPLRAARDEFDRLGTAPWGDLARRELRAAGEASERRQAPAWESLSSRELQIARLAATGLSNKEIGSALFFSHRTVASHLYRIFPKLGITSRAQLGDVLEQRGGDEAASPPSV